MSPAKAKLQKIAAMLVEKYELERKSAEVLGKILRQVHTDLTSPYLPRQAGGRTKALKALDDVTQLLERAGSASTTGERHEQ